MAMGELRTFTNEELKSGIILAAGMSPETETNLFVDLGIPSMFDGIIRFSLPQFEAFLQGCQEVATLAQEVEMLINGIMIALEGNEDPAVTSAAMDRLRAHIDHKFS